MADPVQSSHAGQLVGSLLVAMLIQPWERRVLKP